jgi:hypothetical protein
VAGMAIASHPIAPSCGVGYRLVVRRLRLLDGAGPGSQTVFETLRNALFQAMRGALRVLCDVCTCGLPCSAFCLPLLEPISH